MTRLLAALLRVATLAAICVPILAQAGVPFVGCNSDGQVGPKEAPKGKRLTLPNTQRVAQELSYYQSAQGVGVLGPRGWHCFGVYGSGGDALVLSPQVFDSGRVWLPEGGFSGPAIEVNHRFGNTSGRFTVAEVIARIFPAYRAFVKGVAEAFDQKFVFGPYPDDRLTYLSKRVVEYTTPAQMDGLGTRSSVLKSGEPIDGVAMLVGPEPDLVVLSMRLPPALKHLTPAIVRRIEHDAPLALK